VPTNGVRLTCGDRTLVYSGDTGESEELVTLADGADVLLCEASVGPDEEFVPGLHLTGRTAGEHAGKAGVDRLVVTHVPPWLSRQAQADEAAAAFHGPVEIAVPGAELWI
jgi:ribonuclease BN (tRNA processing enzyme)